MQAIIIGCGNMGSALAQRLSKTHQLYFYDHHIEKAEKLEQEGYGKACRDLKEAIDHVELIILAVKPQNVKEIGDLIGKELKKEQVVVSLLTGTLIKILKEFFPRASIVRMMPNLALIYGKGVIGLSSDKNMPQEDKENLTKTFELLGKIYWLAEDKINALTALTGSGPAFFFVMVEAMVDAGIAMGFTASNAQDLIYQMLQGSLTLLEKSSKHPGELKWQITSPQGTTIAGLKTLEELAIRGGIMNTFLSAYDRANELSSAD
jgi:pyrroline-5-carboxylate reductase